MIKLKKSIFIGVILFVTMINHISAYQFNNYTLKAEMAIVHHDESAALRYYDTSFRLYKPISIDLYNAVVCAIHQKKWKLAQIYVNMLAEIGVNPLFWGKAVFVPLKRTMRWNAFLKKAENIDKDKKATPLSKHIDSLITVDTSVYNLIMESYFETEIPDSLTRVLSCITSDFIGLTKKYGFINETELGTEYNPRDSSINNCNKVCRILMAQFSSLDMGHSDSLEPIVLNALMTNKLRPFDIELLISSAWQNFHGTLLIPTMFMVNDKKMYINKRYSFYDYKRKYWGLGSITDSRDRILFNMHPNDFIIKETSPIRVNDSSPIYIKSNFKANYNFYCDIN